MEFPDEAQEPPTLKEVCLDHKGFEGLGGRAGKGGGLKCAGDLGFRVLRI